MKYERLTKKTGWHKDIDLTQELGYSYIYQRLSELENKIEDGTLIDKAKLSIGSVDKNKLKMKKDDIIWAWQFDNGCCEYRIEELTAQIQNLENKINNGTLIELPCKVGDDAYFVVKHEEDWLIEIGYVTAISIDKDGIWIACHYSSGLSYWHNHKDKKLFFNCAEAEKKLKELQEK